MSFVDLPGLDEVSEKEPAPGGKEYLLSVENVTRYTKEPAGNEVIKLSLSFVEHPEYRRFTHYLSLPGPADDAQKVADKLLMLKRFLSLAHIKVDGGFAEEDLYGANFASMVEQEETIDQKTDKPTGRFQNKLVVPFIRK